MSFRIFVIFSLLIWCLKSVPGTSGQNGHNHNVGESRLDPFEEITQGSFLTVHEFNNFIDTMFDNLVCEEHDEDHQDELSHEQCEKSLCINAEDLVEVVGGNSSEGITEDQFGDASIILLYLVTELGHNCHHNVNVSRLSVEEAESRLLNLTYASLPDHPHIHTSGITALLNIFKGLIDHEGHAHEGEEHDSHDTDEHEGEEHDSHDTDEHEGEEHDSHDTDEHEGEEHDSHDTDEHEGEEHDSHETDEHEGEEHDSHDTHEHEGEEHDSHDTHEHKGEGHEDHVNTELVMQANCLAPDALLYYMSQETSDFIETDQLGQLASITVFLLSQGSDVQESCRLLPQPAAFVQNLFRSYDGNSTHIPIAGLEELMTSLGINPEAHEDGESHAGHNHKRKRRSTHSWSDVPAANRMSLSRRVKRQASMDNQLSQCYSAEQLVALYDASSHVDQSAFQQLCPSLLSQRLYGDCTTETTDSELTDAEKYGYSSLAVFIICLSSIFGVVLIPCASHKMYDRIMAVFLGLAVGTLFADAILHLIPRVFGIHVHEDGHDHGSEIVVEEFVQYGLVIMAALYFFYIIELVMSSCGGHSHGDEKAHNDQDEHEHTNGISMSTMNRDEEKGKKYAVSGSAVKSNQKGAENQLGSRSRGFLGVSPLVVMIVFGDAIHNCADGLLIGASFSGGQISTGLATSIAVLCHELPHELGDFAVLVQSGCSFPKAVFLNLLSSLTAFIGLYVGLSLSTDTATERWILAIASGMFIYIALVDLLPQLVKGRGVNIFFHNLGILLGFACMILLVIFEEHIEV